MCTVAYHPIRFVIFFFFFFFLFFFAKILSGSYLWNRYSQRLQIECAAWFCGLVFNYCLPSNSLCYYYFFFFFSATILSGPYLWNRYLQRLQIQCAAWSCGLISHCCLPSNSLHCGPKFGGSLLGRIQGDREPVSLLLFLLLILLLLLLLLLAFTVGDAIWDCRYSFFFPPQFCPAHISGTITRRDSKLSALLGPAV